MKPFTIVIPARYQSQRLPGKILADIGGNPMLWHVYQRATESAATRIIIATDNKDVYNIASEFADVVQMTAESHPNATNRIAEVITALNIPDAEIIINLQADEPFLPSHIIDQLAENLAKQNTARMATIAVPLENNKELFKNDIVKVVCDINQHALYFSRSPIPWEKNKSHQQHYRHIGIYAYYADFIKQYVDWDHCALEQMESLEQLRVLWHGEKIHVSLISEALPPGVDNAKDLANAREWYNTKNS